MAERKAHRLDSAGPAAVINHVPHICKIGVKVGGRKLHRVPTVRRDIPSVKAIS